MHYTHSYIHSYLHVYINHRVMRNIYRDQYIVHDNYCQLMAVIIAVEINSELLKALCWLFLRLNLWIFILFSSKWRRLRLSECFSMKAAQHDIREAYFTSWIYTRFLRILQRNKLWLRFLETAALSGTGRRHLTACCLHLYLLWEFFYSLDSIFLFHTLIIKCWI